MRHRPLIAVCAGIALGMLSASAQAQTVPLSQVVMLLSRPPGGGGCYIACSIYTVTLKGDGTLTYQGEGPLYPSGTHTATVPIFESVALVNAFLEAHFLDALDSYNTKLFVIRKGTDLELLRSGGIDGPVVHLSLQLGERKKKVILRENYPIELQRLVARLDELGGPRVWQNK